MARVCLDLTANEMIDRFGGIGRYGYLLLRSMLSLPEAERAGLELLALEESDGSVIGAEAALERRVLARPPIPVWQHRWQRRVLSGRSLGAARVELFHAVQPLGLPWRSPARLLATCHDLIPLVFPKPNPPLRRAWLGLRERALWSARMRRADHVLAISEQTARDLTRRLGVPRARISVVYHGVDRELFTRPADVDRVREKYRLPERYFVSVGSDHYRKNHRRLFDAWCQASRDVPEGLVVVGKALYDSTLQELDRKVAELGLGARFRWLPDVADEELPSLYAGATAAIAPSLYEGFGMTLLEAMACGTPVAAARNGAYEEVGGEAALYFDGRSVSELSAALRRLSADAGCRERLIRAGRARAEELSWEKTARETLAVYRKVLGEGRA